MTYILHAYEAERARDAPKACRTTTIFAPSRQPEFVDSALGTFPWGYGFVTTLERSRRGNRIVGAVARSQLRPICSEVYNLRAILLTLLTRCADVT